MPELTKKEMINFYRALLEPMGYTVNQIPTKKEESWKPKDYEKYDKMNSMDLDKLIGNMKAQITNIEKQLRETREKIADLVGTKPMNDFTKPIYISSGQVEKNMVILTSASLEETRKTLDYIEGLRQGKWRSELLETVKEKHPDVISLDMSREQSLGAPQLRISLK